MNEISHASKEEPLTAERLPKPGRLSLSTMALAEIELFLVRFFGRIKRWALFVALISGAGVALGTGITLVGEGETRIGGLIAVAPFLIPLIGSSLTLARLRRIHDWGPYTAVTRRGRIVWVYFVTQDVLVHGLKAAKRRGVVFCDVDGKRHNLAASKREIDRLRPLVARAFPHATIGWTRERDRRYSVRPRSLVRVSHRGPPSDFPFPEGVRDFALKEQSNDARQVEGG